MKDNSFNFSFSFKGFRMRLLIFAFLMVGWGLSASVSVFAATGDITTVAGTGTAGFSGDNGAATAAQLNRPISIHVASNGDIYIADLNNHRIRKVEGIVSVVGPVSASVSTISASPASVTADGTTTSTVWYSMSLRTTLIISQ